MKKRKKRKLNPYPSSVTFSTLARKWPRLRNLSRVGPVPEWIGKGWATGAL